MKYLLLFLLIGCSKSDNEAPKKQDCIKAFGGHKYVHKCEDIDVVCYSKKWSDGGIWCYKKEIK